LAVADQLVLLTGCPRSGTSILGELVATLPDVDYRFEPGHPWWPWGHGEGHGTAGSDRLTERDIVQYRAARRWLAEQHGPIVVEKSPRMLLATRLHRALFPEVKVLHIVRDGRDVACSLAPGLSAPKGARGQVDWHHLRVPNWTMILDATEPGPVRGAHVWALAMQIALDDLEGTDHLRVDYEDLVRSPGATLNRVSAWLGVRWTTATLAALDRVSGTPGHHEAAEQDRWHVPHQRHVGRWRELDEDTAAEVERITAPMRERLWG